MKKLGLGLAALAVVALSSLVGFVAFLHTGPGERWVSGKVEEVSAGRVELDHYQLRWPFRMRADYLRLRDSRGTWLEVTQPELRWQPQRLLRRELHVDRLAAREVMVRREPIPDPPEPDDPGGGLPQWDGTVLLEQLTATIVLAEPVLGERLVLDLGGTFQMRGGGGTVDLHLRSAGGALARLTGTAGTDFMDLRWYLRVPEMGRWQRLAGLRLAGEVVGSGVVAGRLPGPAVSGNLEVGPGWVDDFRWERLNLAARVVPDGHLWNLSLNADAQAPRWGETKPPVPSARLTLAGDLAPEPGRLRLGQGRLEGGGLTLAASGVVDGWGRSAVLRASGDVPDLSRFGIKGAARLSGVLSGDLLAQDLRAKVRARAAGLSVDEIVDGVLGPTPTAEATLRLKGGRLVVEDGHVQGARASARVQGRWARLTMPELSALAPALTGAGIASVRLHGETLYGLAELTGLPVGEGAIAFELPQLDRPQGMLSAAASLAGKPVTGRARFDAGKAVRFDDILVESGNAQLTGELTVIGQGVRGRLAGSVADLGSWLPASGRVEMNAELDPAAGQSARVNLRAGQLAGAGVAVAGANARAELTNLTTKPAGSVTLEAQGVAQGALTLDRLTARLRGDGHSFTYALDGIGPAARVEAAGDARLDGASGQARVERLSVASAGRSIALARPSSVRWGKGEVALAPTLLTMGAGRLDLEGRLAGQRIAARASLDAMPLDVVELVAPELELLGRVSGIATLDGTLADPRAHVELTGQNVGFSAAARAGIGRLATRLVADWRGNRVQAELSARDGDRLQLSANASAPLPGEGPLSGRFRLTGDAGRISESLPLAGHVFAGRLAAEGNVAGTLAQPLVTGEAELTQGRYENLETGTVISPLSATAQFRGDRIQVQAQGGDGGRGTVRAEGAGGLDGSYGGDFVFQRFTALRRDDVEAEIDGTLRLAEGRLAGRLKVPRAEVDIARLKGAGPATLDVVEINKPGQKPTPPRREAAPEPAEVPLALAVEVVVERAFVRGRGLDSEWKGRVNAGGTVSQPSLTGRLVAERGDFDFLGKQFRLTADSAVIFQGGDTIDPTLDVLAQSRAEDITAQVEVTGTAKAPNVQITSDPPLPQDEVLARVLFGRDAGGLSAFQQIQLAQLAASGLTGGGGGFDPVGRVRNFLGLDVLGVGSAQGAGTSNSPTLSAGKYIGRDTFVRVEQGTAGLGEVTVEQELGGGFSVESSVGEQSGGGVGLNWRKDY